MKGRRVWVGVVAAMLALLVATGSAWAGWRPYQPGDSYVECISIRLLGAGDDYPGNWEYVYDVVGGPNAQVEYVHLLGFDGTQIVNLYNGSMHQYWDGYAGFGGGNKNIYPSYWEDTGGGVYDWVLPGPGQPNYPYRYYNEWHDGPDYGHYLNYRNHRGIPDTDGLHFGRPLITSYGWTILLFTFRVVHPDPPATVEWSTYFNTTTGPASDVYGLIVGPGGPVLPAYLEGVELFYNGKFANAADPLKRFLSSGQASYMSLIHEDLFGHVTNYANGITGIRLKFATLVTFSGPVADAFSFEATPEQSSDNTFSAFVPPTAPTFVQDDSSGQTVVEITFANGEIKNRWLKTLFDGSQIGEDDDAEFTIGNRLGDVDGNYRCLLNDAIAIRNKVSGVLVGISNVFDIDKNQRVLLNEAIGARNAVSGIALPALP